MALEQFRTSQVVLLLVALLLVHAGHALNSPLGALHVRLLENAEHRKQISLAAGLDAKWAFAWFSFANKLEANHFEWKQLRRSIGGMSDSLTSLLC